MGTIRPVKVTDGTGGGDASTSTGLEITAASTSVDALDVILSGDTQPRYSVKGDGSLIWGPGSSSTQDVRLRRSGAYTLSLDDNTPSSTNVSYLLPSADARSSLGINTRRFLDVVANTHRVFKAAADVNASTSLTDGALRFGPGGGTALDVQIVRSNTNTVRIDNNASGDATLIVNNNVIVRSFGNGDSLKLSSVPGTITFGPGTASSSPDVRLYRSGANSLTIDNGSGSAANLSVLGNISGAHRASIVSVSTSDSPYTVPTNAQVVFCNVSAGVMSITIPSAVTNPGKLITFKITNPAASGNITITSAGGNIEGVSSYNYLATARNTARFVSDGTNWWQI